MRRAIFGGTFDPIHSAHLRIAQAAADRFQLDQVVFIPGANPPHKKTGTDYEHRYRMVELACQDSGDARFVPSRLEAGVAKSYSIHTIERVRAEGGESGELYFIIGADAFAEIETWFRWQDVVSQVTFIVVARPGHDYQVPKGAKVLRLDQLSMDISSSGIRAAFRLGQRPDEVPQSICDYIREHRLYGSA